MTLRPYDQLEEDRSNVAGSSPPKPDIFVTDTALNVVDEFCYLGSVSQNAEINDDITRRTGAASAAFGRLEIRLWKERGVRLSTKVAVYKAVVITTLLYGCESWITYRRHIRSLDQFHMRCLRRIGSHGRIRYPIQKCCRDVKYLVLKRSSSKHNSAVLAMSAECQTAGFQRLSRVAVGHTAQLPTTAAFQRQLKSQPTVNKHRSRNLGRPSWQQI